MHPMWHVVGNVESIASPALLVYPQRVRENIHRMLEIAGNAERLRPHIKTHKMAEVVRMQIEEGIARFKAATIAEAELAARAGAPDVLLAYQPVGPNVDRLARLASAYPATGFSAVVDHPAAVDELSRRFSARNLRLNLLVDLDVGMHRTGIAPGPQAAELVQHIQSAPALTFAGLHAYDGQIVASDAVERDRQARSAFEPVLRLVQSLAERGIPSQRIVVGGTPTFPHHASQVAVECSPGTCAFWDAGYEQLYSDMGFHVAALVLTRVISKPATDYLCLDLGYKAISADKPHPRVRLIDLDDAQAVTHSEEHLVVKSPQADRFAVGDVLYGVPTHICPSCSLYSEAVVIEEGRATGTWKVAARDRKLSV